MSNSKVDMPNSIKTKCHKVIHSAAVAAAASGAAPIPIADTIPITASQVAMIVALGKVFNISISDSVAKSIVGCGLAQNVGRAISSSILKSIPVVNATIAPIVNGITATAVTETLGWVIADDFYRLSIGEEPENIVNLGKKLETLFKDLKGTKKNSNKSTTKKSSSKKTNNTKKTKK